MPLGKGARNVLESYRYQLILSGGLPLRLIYTSLYWTAALAAKKLVTKGNWMKAHAAALRLLSRLGLTRRAVRVRLPEGLDLELDLFTAFMILKELHADKVYAPDGLEAFSPRPRQIVFDIGAQQGTFTSLAARAVGAQGKVVCVEPEPTNFARLSRNLAFNSLSNVVPIQAALSDQLGQALLYRHSFNTGGHSLLRTSESDRVTRVPLMTLDDLCAQLVLEPDLIKIDVEGSSLAVLRGGRGILKRKRPLLVLERDRATDTEEAKALLMGLGYTWRSSGNNLFASA